MYQTISIYDFQDAFRKTGREDQFSYDGKKMLFDYLEALEDDTGEKVELDVIALCCEYEETAAADIAASYDIDIKGLEEDAALETVLEYLNDNTQVVGAIGTDTILFQSF